VVYVALQVLLCQVSGVDLIGNGIPNIITECFTKEGSHFNIWGGLNNEEIYSKGLLDVRNKYREN